MRGIALLLTSPVRCPDESCITFYLSDSMVSDASLCYGLPMHEPDWRVIQRCKGSSAQPVCSPSKRCSSNARASGQQHRSARLRRQQQQADQQNQQPLTTFQDVAASREPRAPSGARTERELQDASMVRLLPGFML